MSNNIIVVNSTTSQFNQEKAYGEFREEYTYQSKSRANPVWRAAKGVFNLITLGPIRSLFHALVAPVPARFEAAKDCILKNPNDSEYKVITIKAGNIKIRAAIKLTEKGCQNKRWLLYSNGNGQTAADVINSPRFGNGKVGFEKFIDEIGSNAIVFDYPGVGNSKGVLTRNTMKKAYRAVLSYLEDEKGAGAVQIIGYGFSLGGAVQGEALRSHKQKEGIKYVFIKSQSFSNHSKAAYGWASQEANRFCGALAWLAIRLFGWNMSSVGSSRKLKCDEIIIQAQTENGDVAGDEIVTAEASLQYALEKKLSKIEGKKCYLKGLDNHLDPILQTYSPESKEAIVEKVNELLEKDT